MKERTTTATLTLFLLAELLLLALAVWILQSHERTETVRGWAQHLTAWLVRPFSAW